MSFFDEYNKTTTKKGTTTEVNPKNTPAVAPTGSFFNEFTAKKDTPAVPPPVVAPTTTKTPAITSTVTPPTIENPSSFSNFLTSTKKIGASFIADAVTTLSGLAGMPRDVLIYGTKAVKSLDNNLSNPKSITDKDYSFNREKPVTSPRDTFYQDVIDELGKGKLDPNNWDTKIQEKAKQFGDELQLSRGVDPNNRTFGQNLGGGFGSMAGFFVPSFTVAKVGSLLVKSKNAANMYKNVGGVSMVLNESFMEGNQVFQEVYKETGNVQEAQQKADNTVASNIALIGITNKYSKYFENTAPGFRNLVKSALISAISEGPVQEGGQQLISNLNTGRPIFEGVTESAIIGSIVGGVTHMATRNIAPKSIQPEAEAVVIPNEVGGDDGASGGTGGGDDKPKENVFEKLKQQIFKENKGNPIVDEYAKNDGIFTKVMTYIKSTKEVETPEQIAQKLQEAGMDSETVTQMMNESVLQDIRDSAEDVTPEALQAEIDAFMGTAPSEEDTTTPPVVKETVQDTVQDKDQVSQTTKMVDTSMPFDLPSMDIPKEDLPKAQADWSDNYQESYSMKQEDLKTLQKQLKNAKGESKRTTQARIDTTSEQLKNMETEFLKKHAPDQAQELEQLDAKQVPGKELINSYHKKYGNRYTGTQNDPMISAVEHSEVIADIQKDGYTYEQARDIALEVMYKTQEEENKKEPLVQKTQKTKDEDAPTFETADFNDTFDENPVTFKEGDFIVGRDGRVAEVSSGNDKWKKEDPNYDANIGYLRSKRVGDIKDYVEYANQVRLATPEEVKKAQDYAEEHPTLEEMTTETPKKKKATQKEKVKEVLGKKEKATIKEIADATGILEPNVRRILGVGAKEGDFERVA